MKNNEKQASIERYIEAYNNFDVEKMLAELHSEIVFKNISNGEINLTTTGIDAFKSQAEQAKNIFSGRKQTILNVDFQENQVEIQIDYKGILAINLPNGMKIGDELALQGKSIFRFEENKIIEIDDVS